MKYKKTKGHATMKGQQYEVRTAALLYLRCKNNAEIAEFQLATNVEGAGALDDVIMRYKTWAEPQTWRTCFLQLKQKKRASLTLTNLKSKANDFSLAKYLQAYSAIKKTMTSDEDKEELFNGSFRESEFLIYTNVRPNDGDTAKWRPKRGSPGITEALLESGSDQAAILGFGGDDDLIEHLEGTDEVGSDSREFLHRFKLFSGQPDESKLEELIRQELRRSRDVNDTDIDMLYGLYEKRFERWWEKGNDILTEKSDIYERAVEQVTTISVDKLSSLEKERFCFDVEFEEDAELMRNDCASHSLVHIVASESSPRLSCTKLLQFLDKTAYIFYDIQCLQREKDKILKSWLSGEKRDLVVLCTTKSECSELGREICKILNGNKDKRVIIVSQKQDRFTTCLKRIVGDNHKEVEDICRLTQLKETSLEKVKGIEVVFQGHSVRLEKLLNESAGSLKDIILEDSLISSLATNEPVTIGDEFPEDSHYYIPRTVRRQELIRTEIFMAGLKTVIAVSGVKKKDLEQMIPHGERVHLASERFKDGCRFVVLDSKRPMADYERISKTNSSVHWLHKHGAYMEWKGTRGSIKELRPFILEEHSKGSSSTENCFDVSQRTVLLVAEPGMGKSILVSHVAKQTKQKFPDLWVICVELADYIELVEAKASTGGIVEFLASVLGFKEASFAKSLLTHAILQTGNAVVLLDGWDEILPNCKDEGWNLLTNLLETKVKKIWITSRSFFAENLEHRLSTLAARLQQFSEDDQIEFLIKYWGGDCSLTEDDLRDVAKSLLGKLATSLSDNEKRFTGIPLQTMMLAEVCVDYINNPEEFSLHKKFDLLDLFEKFVDKKFKIYIKKTSTIRDDEILLTQREKFDETFFNASLVYLFHPDLINLLHSKENIIETTKRLMENLQLGKDKTGIVDSIINSRLKFVHRCFAEFYAGKWFSKHFKENSKFIADHLLSRNYKVIWKVLNSILSGESELHIAVLNNDLYRVEEILKAGADVNLIDKGHRTPLHLAAGGSFEFVQVFTLKLGGSEKGIHFEQRFIGPVPSPGHMVHLLCEYGADVNKVDAVVQSTPLLYAIRTATWDAAEMLLSNNASTENIDIVVPLQIVADNGFSNVMRLMVDRGWFPDQNLKQDLVLRSISNGHLEVVRILVKDCRDITSLGPMGRSFVHEAAICGQNKILKYLLALLRGYRKFIDKKDKFGHTAMYYAGINGWVSTLELLEEWSANLKLEHNEMATIFHESCGYGHFNVVKRMRDKFGNDPEFKKRCISYIDEVGYSNLMNAAISGSMDIIPLLVANGADVTIQDRYGRTVLQVTVMRTSLSSVKVLLDSFGEDKASVAKYINTPCSESFTSLHALGRILDRDLPNMCNMSCQLLESKAREQADIARVLISNGGDINLTSIEGFTPLHGMCGTYSNPLVVKVFFESIGDDRQSLAKYINMPDITGATAMHHVASTQCTWKYFSNIHEWCFGQRVKTAQLLISNGGDVRAVDKQGRTPLHIIANEAGCLELAKVFVHALEDADSVISYITARDHTGRTAKDYTKITDANQPLWFRKRCTVIGEWLDNTLDLCTHTLNETKPKL